MISSLQMRYLICKPQGGKETPLKWLQSQGPDCWRATCPPCHATSVVKTPSAQVWGGKRASAFHSPSQYSSPSKMGGSLLIAYLPLWLKVCSTVRPNFSRYFRQEKSGNVPIFKQNGKFVHTLEDWSAILWKSLYLIRCIGKDLTLTRSNLYSPFFSAGRLKKAFDFPNICWTSSYRTWIL